MQVQGAVEARNRDYANIVRSLNFVSKGWYDTQVMSDDDADTRRKVSILLLIHRQCCFRGALSTARISVVVTDSCRVNGIHWCTRMRQEVCRLEGE